MYKWLVIICGFSLFSLGVKSQVVLPELTCTEVLASGDVKLSIKYTAPAPTDVIDSVVICFTNNPLGTYTRSQALLPPYINPLVCNVAIPAPDANSQSYYFIGKVFTNGQLLPDTSNRIASVFLAASNASAGNASLTWNAMCDPLLPGAGIFYGINRLYLSAPNNSWTTAGYSIATEYGESIIQCDDSVRYFVQMPDNLGCATVSNTVTRYFLNAKPDTPKLEVVTWNPLTNSVNISWAPSTSADVTGYQIYRITGGTPTLIGNTTGIASTFFNYSGGSPQTQLEEFRIAAVDSCNKISNPGLTHNTLHVDHQLDRCSRVVTFTWNSYLNWDHGVDFYDAYIKVNNTPYTLLGSTSGNSITYSVGTGVVSLGVYVIANDTVDTLQSISPDHTFLPALPRLPDAFYVRTATVKTDSIVEIRLYHDTLAVVKEYRVLRADNPGDELKQIGVLPFSTLSRNLVFRDSLAFTSEQSYYYIIQCIDSCGNIALESNPASTIFLQGSSSFNYTNTVTWNPYLRWDHGIRRYNLYSRGDSSFAGTNPFFISRNQVSCTEDISNKITRDGKYCYYIEAVSNTHPLYLFNDTSRSNIFCTEQEPKIFIPDAFTPNNDQLNDTFTPIVLFATDANYRLRIFDRFGQMVFESLIPSEGWDGIRDGVLCSTGVYAYTLTYSGLYNKVTFRTGTVSLLR